MKKALEHFGLSIKLSKDVARKTNSFMGLFNVSGDPGYLYWVDTCNKGFRINNIHFYDNEF